MSLAGVASVLVLGAVPGKQTLHSLAWTYLDFDHEEPSFGAIIRVPSFDRSTPMALMILLHYIWGPSQGALKWRHDT